MANHNELGKKGEEMAVMHLQKLGLKILERNWRFGRYEIDIIAMDHSTHELVAVEVKTRSGDFFENPEDAVKTPKQTRTIEATNQYIITKELDLEVRFDIVALIMKKGKTEIKHIKNAFLTI